MVMSPILFSFFYDKHTRNDKEKTWIYEVAERTHAGMQEKLAEIVAVEGNETTEMRERAYVAVMGPEKRHRVCGYGLGVIPDMVPYLQIDGSSSSHRSHGRHYAHLQSQLIYGVRVQVPTTTRASTGAASSNSGTTLANPTRIGNVKANDAIPAIYSTFTTIFSAFAATILPDAFLSSSNVLASTADLSSNALSASTCLSYHWTNWIAYGRYKCPRN
ncbi:uncharacterized protein LOC133744086 [Rosa rugosa]|uniref:uncharacterized protein LOC133744086 n=1 Tax=Rosa rugosa TaxID=74645 RepID=UPI002B4065F5|nr:uncharacterized protein LOC133744086 [Rosa rugosa]